MANESYLEQLFNLKGRVVALSAGGGHLCGTMAKGFGKAGMKVVVMDIRQAKAETVAAEIRAEGGESIAVEVDAVSKSSWQQALAQVVSAYGTVDVLVNGAGINAPTPVMDIVETEWDSIMAVHLKGTLFGSQVFGQHMLDKGRGSIINISSASAGPPLSKAFAYSAAKAGISNLTQNMAREWATKGVRVNALRPGFFPTEWSMKNFITEERQKAIWGHTPMGRYGKAEELIGAVLWLASDAASFVTGSIVAVDGGFLAMTI